MASSETAKAAEYLGINRKTLREKIRKYDLESCGRPGNR
jgi:DNA-binding protein Fis